MFCCANSYDIEDSLIKSMIARLICSLCCIL